MSEEGAAKLRLKPRAAPPARGPGPDTGPTSTDRCPWFEKKDLKECEKAWISLLKDASGDLHCTNWDTVPRLPELLEKGAEERPGHQEVFTAGMRDFQWVPFPPFHTEQCLNPKDFSSQSQSNESDTGWGQADQLPSLSSTAEETRRGTSTDQGKTTAGEGTKGISHLGVSPEPRELPGHRSSAQPLAPGSVRAFSPQQHLTGAAQSRGGGRRERGKKELQPREGKVPAGEDRAVPAEPPGSVPGAGSCEEKVENQSGGSSALDSCPMCLTQFSGTLSQLDIDGHLARCLSESADDVVW